MITIKNYKTNEVIVQAETLKDIAWRAHDFRYADLSGLDLSNLSLIGVNFGHAKMDKTNLSKAELINANLAWARLVRANLKRADLFGANLSNADIRHAELDGIDFDNANLTNIKVTEPISRGVKPSVARKLSRENAKRIRESIKTTVVTIAMSTVALAFGSIIFNMWFDIPEELKKIACKVIVTVLLLLLPALLFFARQDEH